MIGSVYALTALGLNVIFGTMRVINFPQRALLMVAMFISIGSGRLPGQPVSLAIDLGAGAVCDRLSHPVFVYRAAARSRQGARADERPAADPQAGARAEKSHTALFHADFKTVRLPISRATFKFAGLIVSEPRLIAFATMLVVAGALYLFFTRTDLCRAIRAVGQDRQAARVLGIDDRRSITTPSRSARR